MCFVWANHQYEEKKKLDVYLASVTANLLVSFYSLIQASDKNSCRI